MYTNTIFAIATMALSTFSNAMPLEARAAVTVNTDGATASVTPTQTIVLDGTDGETAAQVGAAVEAIVEEIQAEAKDDITKRKLFTQQTVASVSSSNPGQNVITSNVGYTLSCTPAIRNSVKFDASIGAAVSYDVLVFGAGCTFTLNGDGGFQNWAFVVSSSCKVSGKTITC